MWLIRSRACRGLVTWMSQPFESQSSNLGGSTRRTLIRDAAGSSDRRSAEPAIRRAATGRALLGALRDIQASARSCGARVSPAFARIAVSDREDLHHRVDVLAGPRADERRRHRDRPRPVVRVIALPRKASSVFEQTNKCHHGNAIMNGPALATGLGHSSWHSGSLFRYLPGDRGRLPAGAPSTAATRLRAEKVSCFFAGGGIERGCHLRGRRAGQTALQRGLLPLVGGRGEPRERARHRVGVQTE